MRSFDDIKELIRIVQETGIGEIEVQEGDYRIRVSGSIASANQAIVTPQVFAAIAQSPAAVPVAASGVPRESEEDRDIPVTSPIVGTYYDSPAPGAAPFVKVGDRVEPKQVLCIIESMKLMNEIEAETAGVVAAKLVENGRPVEYGQTLFTIRPA
ncbi:MAG: acetyl-CoA carboxylase biotin carboxyl carrier protein [Bryobacteraceae bacterium]